MAPGLFLSHTRADKDFARRLAADLKARNVPVWIDEAELKVGDSLIGKLESAIDDLDYLCVILSPESVRSNWVLSEVRMAMHREFSGKRVVVIPVLHKDCEVPGFLRDKIYADFRRPDDYARGVHQIVQRISTDLEKDPSYREVTGMLDDLAFTSLWKAALRTRKWTQGFGRQVRATLARLSQHWDPLVASSYLMFLAELAREGVPGRESWPFLCPIVEDADLNRWLRFMTLDHMLETGSLAPEDAAQQLPRLFTQEGEAGDLVAALVEGLFDPTAAGLTPDHGTYPRILGTLWARMSPALRGYLLAAVERYAQAHAPEGLALLAPLRGRLLDPPGAPAADAFQALRESWETTDLGSPAVDEKSRAMRLLKNAMSERHALKDCAELLELFRRASALQESDDFSLYVLVFEFLKKENLAVIRELQGDRFAHDLLVGLVCDRDVEVILSVLALTSLVMIFGPQGLCLDDRLPEALFEVKRRGCDRLSVVNGLCEAGLSDPRGGDETSVLLLAAILSLEGGRRDLVRIIEPYARSNKRARALLAYERGALDYAGLLKACQARTSRP